MITTIFGWRRRCFIAATSVFVWVVFWDWISTLRHSHIVPATTKNFWNREFWSSLDSHCISHMQLQRQQSARPFSCYCNNCSNFRDCKLNMNLTWICWRRDRGFCSMKFQLISIQHPNRFSWEKFELRCSLGSWRQPMHDWIRLLGDCVFIQYSSFWH